MSIKNATIRFSFSELNQLKELIDGSEKQICVYVSLLPDCDFFDSVISAQYLTVKKKEILPLLNKAVFHNKFFDVTENEHALMLSITQAEKYAH